MNLLDHSTDKILMLIMLMAVLAAAVYTMDPTMMDAFKIGLGATITALAQRITFPEQK